MYNIGILVLCVSTIFLGLSKSRALQIQQKLLNCFINDLKSLKIQIEYSSNALGFASAQLSEKSKHLKEFWLAFSKQLPLCKNAKQSWSFAKKTIFELDSQTNEILEAFFENLGKSETTSQCALIDATNESLCNVQSENEKQNKQKCKLYNAMGISFALIIFIALI